MTYCERIDATFWAEPINAITNLAFIVAAVGIVFALARDGQPLRKTWDLWLLAGLVATIGIGSVLWHTLATPWSALADVVPIVLFINVYLLSFLIRVAQRKTLGVIGWFLVFHGVNLALLQVVSPEALNGSVFYVPTWATLWIMVAFCWRTGSRITTTMLAAALAFTLSLTLRTLDVDLCAAWPQGTHFAWHLLNGLVLYLAMMALINAHRREPFSDP